MDGLIEDLRTLSRADAGELPIEFQPVSLAKLLEKVQTMHKQHAARKNIAIDLQVEPDLPEISADPGRMVQVLSNLVDNALLYTPEGGRVIISARWLPKAWRSGCRTAARGLRKTNWSVFLNGFTGRIPPASAMQVVQAWDLPLRNRLLKNITAASGPRANRAKARRLSSIYPYRLQMI